MKRIFLTFLLASVTFVMPTQAKTIDPVYLALGGHVGTTALSFLLKDVKHRYGLHGAALALSGGLAAFFQHQYVRYRKLAKVLATDEDERMAADYQLLAAYPDVQDYAEALDRAQASKRKMKVALLFSAGEGLNGLRSYLHKRDQERVEQAHEMNMKTLAHRIGTQVKAYNYMFDKSEFKIDDVHSLPDEPTSEEVNGLIKALSSEEVVAAGDDDSKMGLKGQHLYLYAARQQVKLEKIKVLLAQQEDATEPEKSFGLDYLSAQSSLMGLASGFALL